MTLGTSSLIWQLQGKQVAKALSHPAFRPKSKNTLYTYCSSERAVNGCDHMCSQMRVGLRCVTGSVVGSISRSFHIGHISLECATAWQTSSSSSRLQSLIIPHFIDHYIIFTFLIHTMFLQRTVNKENERNINYQNPFGHYTLVVES